MTGEVTINTSRRGVALVVLAAVLWSTSGLLVRLISADEATMVFWRSVSAALFLSCYVMVLYAGSWRSMSSALGWPGLVVAILLATDAILSVFALANTRVANVMLIFSTAPFFTAIIAWVWLREPVASRTWAAMSLSVVGVAIMVSGSLGSTLLLGDGLAFVVVAVFSIVVVTIRRYPFVDLIAAVWVSSILAAAASLPFATPLGHSVADYTLMGVFGAFEYALALILFTSGARHIAAAKSTLIGLLEVVLSPIWVWLAVNEVPGEPTLIGGALILVTLVVYTAHDLYSSGDRGTVVR